MAIANAPGRIPLSRRTARIGKGDVPEADLTGGHAARRPAAGRQRTSGAHRRFEARTELIGIEEQPESQRRDHDDAVLLEHVAHDAACQRVVVGDDHAQRLLAGLVRGSHGKVTRHAVPPSPRM